MSDHRELLRCVGTGQHPARPRMHNDLLAGRRSIAVGAGALGNPSFQDHECSVRRPESLAPHVRHSQQRLLQHQAFKWGEHVDPAIETTTNQRLGVVNRVEGEQRQAETALAIRGSVTTARVAPLLGHRRQCLVFERNRVGPFLTADLDRHLDRLTLPHDLQLGLPINTDIRWTHTTVMDRHQPRFVRTHSGEVCHISQSPVGLASGDHQLDTASTRCQPNHLGIHLDGRLRRWWRKRQRDHNQANTPQHVVSPAGFLSQTGLRTVHRWAARAGTTESADQRACRLACADQSPVSHKSSRHNPRS